MRFHWERSSRLPRPPWWAAALVGCWLLLVLGGVLVERRGAPSVETCLFHRLSGHPCPTCGSTRVVLAFTRGDWTGALRLNPLVALGLGLVFLWLLTRLATGRTLHMTASLRERGALLAVGVTLLLANWIWVLQTQP
ncbi:DUF2752 domain-containing protein [Geothrix alkalitolerans]|uniref:DUF2752 domain-containing protein n=1 Tax=Geothrix alkalitolerans TaxID=2922724 RepID=UPI001FAFAB23